MSLQAILSPCPRRWHRQASILVWLIQLLEAPRHNLAAFLGAHSLYYTRKNSLPHGAGEKPTIKLKQWRIQKRFLTLFQALARSRLFFAFMGRQAFKLSPVPGCIDC